MLLRQERDPKSFIRNAKRGNPYSRRRNLWQLTQLAFAVLCMAAVVLVAMHRRAEAFRIPKLIEIVEDTGPNPTPGGWFPHCFWIKLCSPDIYGTQICVWTRVCT